jgi:hypothetical protein
VGFLNGVRDGGGSSSSKGHDTASQASDPDQLHRIELIWSVKSGKTRVLWDWNDITHLFPPGDIKERYQSVQLSWSSAGAHQQQPAVAVQIEAHADVATDLARRPQYDLKMNGVAYRSLPTRDEMILHQRRREEGQRQELDVAEASGELGVEKGEPPPSPSSSSTSLSSSSLARQEGQSDPVDWAPRHPGTTGVSSGVSAAGESVSSPVEATRRREVRDENGVIRDGSHVADAEQMSDLESGLGDDARAIDDFPCVTPSSSEFDFRLSMVGLKHVGNNSAHSSPGTAGPEVVDELRSELYSPMLETLRLTISEHLPQLEDVVSKAIIQAFFTDADSSHHSFSALPTSSSPAKSQQHGEGQQPQDLMRCSSNASSASRRSSTSRTSGTTHHRLDATQLELDTLKAAHDFVAPLPLSNETQEDSRSESGLDLRHVFMQKQIESICWLVRNDEVTPGDASRILLRLACLLELDFASPIPVDTVLLAGLDDSATPQDLAQELSAFGEVSTAAVSPGGFGLARFRDSSFAAPLEAANHDCLSVQGKVPQAIVLSCSSLANQNESESQERVHPTAIEMADGALRRDPPSLSSNRPDSPPETIPHLMALGDYCISFMAPNSSLSTIATVPDKPRPISEATSSTGSSSTQDTVATTAESSSPPRFALR